MNSAYGSQQININTYACIYIYIKDVINNIKRCNTTHYLEGKKVRK